MQQGGEEKREMPPQNGTSTKQRRMDRDTKKSTKKEEKKNEAW